MTGRMKTFNGSRFRFDPFSKKQRQIFTWWNRKSPVHDANGIIADGAIRSGKTLCMSLSFVMWAMENFDGENFAMCGKTIGSFRRNVMSSLYRTLKGRGYRYEYHRTDSLIIISKGSRTNHFYIFGGKDESSQDLIQGITLAGVFLDEVALMPKSFVNQATSRCSVDGSKWWFNCNPDGPYHWFKKEWLDKAQEKKLIHLHFTLDDNLSLTETIKDRYEHLYTGVFYKRYILGLWCMAEGMIYDMFDEDRHVKPIADIAPKLIDNQKNRFVSCDYGTQNATVFLLWNKGTDGKWYCIREYYYSGREKGKQKTDSEYADDLLKWLDGTKIRAMIVDPAAASFIAELRKRSVQVMKGSNDVLDGIRTVGTLLNHDRILFADTCTNTIQEFGSYVWDEKAAANGEDRPVKKADHAMDAVRYMCYTVISRGRAKLKE